MNWVERQQDFDLARLRAFHADESQRIDDKQYEQLYRNALARGISDVTRVYLDTDYWIRMREVAQGTAKPIYVALYERIREAVRSRRLICLYHHTPFMEAAKQNTESLNVLASVVDEFTESTAIAPHAEIIEIEACEYIARYLGIDYDSETARWTRTIRMFQSALPNWVDGRVDRPDIVKKIALDNLLNYKLADMLEALGETVANYKHRFTPELIAALERGKVEHIKERRMRDATRKAMFSAAIAAYYRAPMKNFLLSRGTIDPLKLDRILAELESRAVAEFISGTLGRSLANGRIDAELFADYLHGDPRERLKVNTLIDHQHAAVALPHCHAFFTEFNLTHKLTQLTGLADVYRCEVVAEPTEAIKVLDRLGV